MGIMEDQLDDKNYNLVFKKQEALDRAAIISIADSNGKITYVNSLFSIISGYSADELLGNDHRILNSGYHSKEFFEDFWKTIQSGKIWRGEVKNKKKSGEFYWVYASVVPVFDQSTGGIFEYVSVRFDISDQKITEESFVHEQEKNIHLSRMTEISAISAGLSHEINNPLTIAQGRLKTLKRKVFDQFLHLDQEFNSDFIKIEESLERISKIIKSTRSFSTSSESTVVYACSVSEILDNVRLLFEESVKDYGIKLEINCQANLVLCNPIHLEQVFINLLNNSIYEVKNLHDRWINISAIEQENYIDFAVVDSGEALGSYLVEKIMVPFFTTKPFGNGVGLGLSANKRLIEFYYGTFTYDSNNKNVCFRFCLPKNELGILKLLNIESVKKAHLEWKAKLLNEILNKQKILDSAVVANCDICKLGLWISKSKPSFSKFENFHKLINTHKVFHKEAGAILDNIQSNNFSQTCLESLRDINSPFNQFSKDIIIYLDLLEYEIHEYVIAQNNVNQDETKT
jgi:PAS domain S-box-containing protein